MEKIVVVTRRTRLEELVARFNTLPQARFYIEHMGLDFSEYYLPLTLSEQTYPSLQAARDAGVPVIAYGSFINAVIKFVIIAFALFIIVKQMNRLRRMMERETAEAPADVVLLTEIRDLLKGRGAAVASARDLS